MKIPIRRLPTATAFALVMTFNSQAATLVSDNFNSATTTPGSSLVNSVLNYNYINSTASTNVGLPSVDFGSGATQVLGLNTPTTVNSSYYVTANLPSTVNLTAINDYVQLNFDFQVTGTLNQNRFLRYGLYDSGTTNAESVGYFGAGGTGPTQIGGIFADTSTVANDFFATGLSGGTSSSVAASTTYSASLNITLTGASQITVTSTYAGVTFTNLVSNANLVTSFDQLWLGGYSRSTQILVDNVVVTTNAVPEPGSAQLLMTGGMASLSLLRRRRRC